MVTRIFQLLLLISPIAVTADINLDIFDLIFFRTGVIVLFMASLLDKPRREVPQFINKIVFILIGLSIWNMFIHDFAQPILATQMNLFLFIVGFYTVYRYLDEKQHIAKYIILAMFINIGFFFLQKIGFDPIFDSKMYLTGITTPGGFMGNTARLSLYIALIVPFLNTLLFPLVLFTGYLTEQYTILIPMVLCLIARVRSIRIKKLIAISAVLLALCMSKQIYYSFKVRFTDAWFPVLQLLFDKPLIGWGLGVPLPVERLGVMLNSYLQFISGIGILGAVWFGYVFKSIYKNITLSKRLLPLIVLLLVMFIEYPVEIPRFWFLIMGILVLSLRGVISDAGKDIGEVIIG